MEEKKLLEVIKKIQLSEKTQKKIIEECYSKLEEIEMKKNHKLTLKPVSLIMSFVLLLSVTTVSAYALSDQFRGYFKNIIRWDGAITGQIYENADQEINASAARINDEVYVTLELLRADERPYNLQDKILINHYEILDEKGRVVEEKDLVETTERKDNILTYTISLTNIQNGNYTINIHDLMGIKKAEQDLLIKGNWKVEFKY